MRKHGRPFVVAPRDRPSVHPFMCRTIHCSAAVCYRGKVVSGKLLTPLPAGPYTRNIDREHMFYKYQAGVRMQAAPSTSIQTLLETIRRRWGSDAVCVARDAPAPGTEIFPRRQAALAFPEPLAPLEPYIRCGQIVEISGAPGSGKSGLAVALLATLAGQEHTRHGLAAYVDSPRTFFAPGAAAIGVDLSRLWVVRLPGWYALLAATETLLGSGVIDVVLWDLVGRRESPTSAQLQRLRMAAAPHNTTLLLLTTQPARRGYRPLDYLASLRLVVHRQELLFEQYGRQRLLSGYRLHVEIARAPGKRQAPPLELTLAR